MKTHICMVVTQRDVKGGMTAVISAYYGSRLEEDYDISYIETYCDGSKWTKLRKALRGYLAFRRLLRSDPPALVHVHSSFGPSFWRKLPIIDACARRGIPVVNHIHGSEFDRFYTRAGRFKKRQVRRVYGECAAILTLTEAWKERFLAIVPEEKIEVLHNYTAIRTDGPTPESRVSRQITFLGLINPMKGSRDMPEIITRVCGAVPDARFVLCGVGETEAVREGLPEELREKNVCFPGWIRGEEKDRVMRSTAVFLLPSYSEAMPMSILEAMGYAIPAVATRVGGIPRLIEDGVNGCLYEPGDAAGMAEGIIRYLTHEEEREAAGAASLAAARRDYSLERHIEELERIYEKCLERR